MTENILETYIKNEGGVFVEKNEIANQGLLITGSAKQVIDLEKYRENPSSITGNLNFDDLRGFVEYVNDFKGDHTVIFAKKERITAVFDHSKKDSPKWGRHTATYEIKPSSRWSIWARAHNVWMTQKDFAEFLDTGLNEIVNPAHSTILSMVKNFRATVNHEVDSEDSAGGTSFTYRKVTKGGGNIKTENVEIPDFLKVQLQPFENLSVINPKIEDESKKIPAYELTAKINWRVQGDISEGSQTIQFKIQILNIEKAIDETLEMIRGAMSILTGSKTYIG